jgi:phosphoglycolate phosphatase-like HAD superfamily hydrolase
MISRTKEAHRRSLEAHTKRVGDKPMSREEIALVISRTKEAHRRRLSERDKELAILGEDVAILEERVERLREDMDEMKKSERKHTRTLL